MKQVNLFIATIALLFSATSHAQTARVQVIHNSADAAAATVDIYLDNTLLIDDFDFRTASPFIDAPAGTQITIGVAPSTSTMSSQSIATFPITLTANETYVVVANGVVSPTGYTPTQAFGLDIYNMGRESANVAGNTDVLVVHGSTDAPAVDVFESSVPAGTIVDDASYGDFAGYLELGNADYILDVQDMTGATTVASYQAPLATLGLADSAIVVVASGFLDPSMNSNGAGFGLWVALPMGGNLIELPAAPAASTARVQVIHNSADAAAATVDIWLDNTLLIDDFDFRTASPFIDAPAGSAFTIGVAPSTSTMASQSIATFPLTLTANETYIVVANGIVSATGYTPAAPFGLDVYNMGREMANTAGNTDVLVVHGSTDAPTVDVVETTAGIIVDNASYGNFAGYLELPTADYTLNIQDQNNTSTVAAYQAPLATLGLTDSALVVVASGFLDPTMNSNGPGFGLWVALPMGGALIELPTTSGLSITENETNVFTVYPNPAENVLMIQGENVTLTNAVVTDITGKVVINQAINNGSIDISNLDAGKYFVTISNTTSIETISIVKK